MNDEPRRRPLGRALADLVLGTGAAIAGTVYGTIVVMATITVGYASEKEPWRMAGLVAGTAVVLWVAHLYAHALSESIAHRQRLRQLALGSIARRELGILVAAVLPTAALVLGAVGLVREASAVWLALAVGLATLAVEGMRYARLENLAPRWTIVAVALNLALGSLVVVLKVALAH